MHNQLSMRNRVLPPDKIWLIGWAVLGYVAFFGAFVLLAPAGDSGRQAALNLGQMVVPTVAAMLCLAASRHVHARRERWAWRLFALAQTVAAGGFAIWAYYELGLAASIPSPSWADAVGALYYPFSFLGIILLVPWGQRVFARVTVVLDALLFTLCAAGLSWRLIMAPALAGTSDPLRVAIGLSWPLGDILLTFGFISWVLRWPLDRIPTFSVFLLGAFSLRVIASSLFGLIVLGSAFSTGSAVDPLWPLVNGLVALAALQRLKNGHRPGEASREDDAINLSSARGFQLVLPYLTLPVAGVLLYLGYAEGPQRTETGGPLIVAIAMLVIGLLFVRQIITVMENDRLGASLTMASYDLEVRVSRRTAELRRKTSELSALNQVATQLSQCLNGDEVQLTGLDMACRATKASAGVVWLLRPDGTVDMVAHRGIDPERQSIMAQLPSTSSRLARALLAGDAITLRHPDICPADAAQEVVGLLPSGLLVVPLTSRRTVLGAIGLVYDRATTCTSSELELVQSIGAEVGVALENARRYEEAKYLADREPVTGLLNHRAIHERLEDELRRASQTGGQLSLIMMDIDGFKLFNDIYGHPEGDRVLREVANVLQHNVRGTDLVGRYGGDEFIAVLPGTPAEGAVLVAKRLQASMGLRPYLAPDGQAVPINLSFGLAAYPKHGQLSQELVRQADKNLYESKQRGGDTITAGDRADTLAGAMGKAFGLLDSLITAVDNKDHYTRKHCQDVQSYALTIARSLNLAEEQRLSLSIAGLLHDVGKIGIPDRILRKPSRLTEEEYEVVRQHVTLGEALIRDVPNLAEVVAAVGAHHERFDGAGYPRGLRGEEIPLLGRILAVADVYSALTTDRPYRKGIGHDEAREELRRLAGTHLDPELVEALVATPAAMLAAARARREELTGAVAG